MTTAAIESGSAAEPKAASATRAAAIADRDSLTKLGLTGGVLLAACLFVVVLVGRPKPAEVYAFVFLTGVAPPLAAVVLFTEWNPGSAANRRFLARLFLCFCLFGVLLLGTAEYSVRAQLPGIWFLITILGSAIAAATIYGSHYAGFARRYATSGVLDVLLVGLLAAVVIVFSPFDPAQRLSTLADYINSTQHFAWWLGFGLIFVAAVTWLWQFEDKATIPYKTLINRLALFVFFLFVLSLFDDELYLNPLHYLVHIGPAMHALHGGIAMVDVYSIYGLGSWEAVKLGLAAIAPTFGTMALIVRISMLAYYLAISVALYNVAQRRLSAMIMMMPLMLVAVTFHPGLYNLNSLPSTSGLRYLVPALMVVVLTTARSPACSRWLATAILMLASLWSIEDFIYTLAPWGYVLFLRAVRTRSIREPAITLLIAVGAVALAQLAFVLGTYYSTGRWIDYGPYLGLVDNFRPDRPGFWAQFADPNFATWVLDWFALFLVLAGACYHALRGREPTDLASRLVPIAAFGFAELNYFAGFPRWSSLGLAFLPIAAVLVCCLEALAIRPRRYGPSGVAAFVGLIMLAAALVAFGSERFTRSAVYDQANRTVLRRCFSAAGCQLAQIPARLKQELYASPLDPNGPIFRSLHDDNPINVPEWYRMDSLLGFDRVKELVAILRQYTPQEPPLGLFVDVRSAAFVSVAALMETGQWYRWPISSPLNDDISPGVTKLILNRVAKSEIRDGELVIISNIPSRRDREPRNPLHDPNADRDLLLTLEDKMLDLIKTRCRLALVETREYYSIYRTEACRSPDVHAQGQ